MSNESSLNDGKCWRDKMNNWLIYVRVSYVVNHIWKERNGRMHGQTFAAPNQIVQHIQDDIRLRLISLKSIANDAINCRLCHNWGLSLISSFCLWGFMMLVHVACVVGCLIVVSEYYCLIVADLICFLDEWKQHLSKKKIFF